MGGMIAIAFAALHGDHVIATCADVAFAKPDVYRRTLFRLWRRMAETMTWDDFSDHVTTQAVGAGFLESEAGCRHLRPRACCDRLERPLHRAAGVHRDGGNGPLAARAADLDPLLMTNGTHDILCPPALAPSGLGARQMAAHERAHHDPRVPGHRPRRPPRVPRRRRAARVRLLPPAPRLRIGGHATAWGSVQPSAPVVRSAFHETKEDRHELGNDHVDA